MQLKIISLQITGHRLKITRYNTLICDSYNANPDKHAVWLSNHLQEFSAESKSVILGDMLELGEKSEEEHIKII